MGSRIIVRIELTPSAKDKLNTLSEKKGMTQVAMLSRLVEWLAAAPPAIQGAALCQYPAEIERDIARLLLSKIEAAGNNKKKSK